MKNEERKAVEQQAGRIVGIDRSINVMGFDLIRLIDSLHHIVHTNKPLLD